VGVGVGVWGVDGGMIMEDVMILVFEIPVFEFKDSSPFLNNLFHQKRE